MASGGYDPSLPRSPASNAFRRSSNGMSYDIGPNAQARRTSLSPVITSRRISAPYDSYAPSRAGPSHRDDFPNANNYRPDPNAWRPPPTRPASAYYSRSPSPNRYDHPRGSEINTWGRSISPGAWQPPSLSWSDRRPVATPPSAPRDRPHRDIMAQSMSQPLFEPSDVWKKTHDGRPVRNDIPTAPSANRFPAPRPPVRRVVSPSRNDYVSPYYATENNYRPSETKTYTYGVSRANNYRPQYDDNNAWGHSYSRDISQPLSIGPRREVGPTRQASRDTRDGYPFRSYSPSPERPLRGRPSRRPNYDSMSRSGSKSSRPSPKTISIMSQNNHNAPRRRRRKSRTRSRSRSRSRSRFRTRSLSSSDVASTRASQRSSREPPKQRPSPVCDPTKSRQHDTLPSAEPNVSLSYLPTGIPMAQTKSVENKGSPVSRSEPHLFSQLIVTKQEEDVITVPSQNEIASVSTSKAPDLSHAEQPGSQSSPQPRSLDLDILRPTPPGQSSYIGSGVTEPKVSIVPTSKVTQDDTRSTPVIKQTGVIQPTVVFSSPLSSPARSLMLDTEATRPHDEAGTMLSAKVLETSDTTTDDEDNLPNMSDARSIADALRVVVMTRLRCDRQTREERVEPVLMAHRSTTQTYESKPSTSSDQLIRDVTQGKRMDSRMKTFPATKSSLVTRFAKHQEALSEKTERLREEYLVLHERWQAHCAKLDNKSNKKNTKDAPAPTDEVVVPASSGRSTRRTAAMLGDAVRSDLEMEQIIASLGVEELTDPNHLALRNLAKIPDMISVSRGEVDYLFDDTNNLVDNPERFYDSSTGTDTWTEEEKEIFLEQFAANPKQFGIIASFLPAKTSAQCVAFYYLHKKKHVDFRKVVSLYAPGKRRRGGRRTDKQKGNALMADIRQHDDEVSLSHSGPTTRRKRAILPSAMKPISSRLGAARMELTPASTPTPDPEPEVRKRGRRSNTAARVSTLVDDMNEDSAVLEPKPAKRGRKGRKPKTPVSMPEDSPTPTTEGNSNESATRRKAAVNAHWSGHDKSLFLVLLSQHGDDFKRIAASMPNKTTIQVNNYYKSNAAELDLDKIVASAPKRSPTPETASDAWAESSKFPGSGVMTPVAATATDVQSHTDIDRQLSLNSHVSSFTSLQRVRDILDDRRTQSTSTSVSLGDVSGTLHRSALIEPAPQLGSTPDPAEQHRSQKPLHFTRFVPSSITATSPPGNQDTHFPPVSHSSTFSFASYSESSYPNREVHQASRNVPIVFYEQNGTRSSTGRAKSSRGNSHPNSLPDRRPDSGSFPHIPAHTSFHPEIQSQSQWSRPSLPPLSSRYARMSQSDYFAPS